MGAVGQRHALTSLPPGNEPTVAIPDTALLPFLPHALMDDTLEPNDLVHDTFKTFSFLQDWGLRHL
jgi:hypothetical protein